MRSPVSSAELFGCLLLVIPSVAERKIDELFLAQRFAAARRLAVVTASFASMGGFAAPALRYYHDLELAADRPARSRARSARAESGRRIRPPGGLRNRTDFCPDRKLGGIVAMVPARFCGDDKPRLFFRFICVRSGETGELDELVRQLAAHIGGETSARTQLLWRFNLALALAFCGRTDEFVRLTEGDRSTDATTRPGVLVRHGGTGRRQTPGRRASDSRNYRTRNTRCDPSSRYRAPSFSRGKASASFGDKLNAP